MNSRILGTVLFALINLAIQAQNLDSLKRVVTITKSDINKATLFADISEIETQTDSILYYADKAIAFGEKTNNSIALAKAYISKGRGYNKLNRRDSAKYFIKRGLSLAPNNSKVQSYGFSILGGVYHNDFKLDSAEYYYNKTLEVKDIHLRSIGFAYKGLTQVYNSHGKEEEAEKAIKKAIEFYKLANDKSSLSKSYISLAETYRRQNNYKNALNVLDLAEQNTKKGSYEYSLILSEKSIILKNNQKLEAALDYQKEALDILQKNYPTYTNHIAHAYHRIASIHLGLKEFDKSIQTIEKAQVYIAASDYWKTLFMNIKALTFDRAQQKDSAKFYYLKTNSFYKKLNMNRAVATTNFRLGSIYIDSKEYEKAKKQYHLAIDLGNKYNFQNIIQESTNALSKVHEAIGDYKMALLHHKKYIAIKDSLSKVDNKTAISELQVKYETEKKEKNILALEKENQQKDMAFQKEKQFYIILISVIASIFVIFLIFSFNRKKKNLQLALELKNQKEIAHIKNTFLENLSHEIRTPISVINGYLHLIKQNNLFPSKILQFSELASKSSDVIINNLNSFITLIKLDQNPFLKDHSKNDFIDVYIKELVHSFTGNAALKGIGFLL